jgi:type II secretory pathway component PulJ
VLAVLELNRHVDGIAERIPHLENVIDDLARDMPRLGFRRRSANGRERPAADAEKVG